MVNNFAGNDLTMQIPGRSKWWVWVAVALTTCCCLVLAGLVSFFVYFSREPENLSVDYSIPSLVKKGELFDFTLTLTNTGSEPITVASIDLDEALGGSILDGCIVLETEPFMERDYSLKGIKSFTYNQTIQPGETKTLIFQLQGTTAGEFGGSVGVYVGDISKRIDYVGIIIQE